MTDYKKLYKEALERAKYWAEGKCVEDFDDSPQNVLDFVFPEAKESEDEKIRKFLIKCVQQPMGTNLLNGIKKDDVIAWLKKQGEQKPADTPNFKVGDWIITNDELVHEEYRVCRIEKIEDDRYYIDNGDFLAKDTLEAFDYHLWTIQDAKEGDVLADDYSIIIFRKIGNETWNDVIDYYVGWNYENKSGIKIQSGKSHYGKIDNVDFKPATKEQRDLLFTKMKEDGYGWDAEDKVLGKIEQKPQTELPKGEDYGIDSLYHAVRILEKTLGEVEGYQSDDGILGHKCAIEAVKRLYEHKSAWGEEDEDRVKTVLYILHEVADNYNFDEWLKSLKDRVQPQPKWSEEDEIMLDRLIKHFNKNEFDRGYEVGISAAKFNQWRPTEEQMDDFYLVLMEYGDRLNAKQNPSYQSVKYIYEQLKKL